MKICFVTYNVFDLGGIQRVVSVIATELSKEHEVHVLCTNSDYPVNRKLYNLGEKVNVEINDALVSKKIILKILCKIGKEINKRTGILNNKKLIKLISKVYYPKCIQDKFINYINSNNYDVVIGVAGEFSLLLGIIADKVNAKTIGWQHNSFDAYLKNKNRYFWNQDVMFKEYIPKLNKYVVLSKYDKDKFENEMNIKSEVIHNPKSFKSDIKSKLGEKQFLAAGRFNYQKGFDLLIESFSIFAKDNDVWKLVIVGEGEENNNIKSLIEKYELKNRISIQPFTDDIQEYFLNSSSLLLPSRWEGMPMIVLESLEMGVPIVSYDISAIHELVENNVEGFIVEKFNTKAFAHSMKIIAERGDVRNKMGKNAMKKAVKFEIEAIIEEWNNILKV